MASNLYLHAAVAAAMVQLAAAQSGRTDQAADKDANPVALVARAEALINKGEKEEAQLLLWQTLELLGNATGNAVLDATRLSARFLLSEHDPYEMERRAVLLDVANKQVAIGKAYRMKKWHDTAGQRFDIADQFDPDASQKERVILATKQKPDQASSKTKEPAKPRIEANADTSTIAALLQRSNATTVSGSWIEQGNTLESAARTGNERAPSEWITKQAHADNEIVVEFRSLDPKADHDVGISLGINLHGDGHYDAIRVQCCYDASAKAYGVFVWQIAGMTTKELGNNWFDAIPDNVEFRRLSVRVMGETLLCQINAMPAFQLTCPREVRGLAGLIVGTGKPNPKIQFRNLRVEPLPADQPSDEDLREQNREKQQHAITTAVDEAKDLLATKQPEAAAGKLREALEQLTALPQGVLRDNLSKSIVTMLSKADPLTKKRAATASECANTLALLADKYALDGRPRMALVLAHRARSFDPESQDLRIAAIEKAIGEWNATQLVARAADLAPPSDDGSLLREWFAAGRLLDNRTHPWIIEGAAARVENLSEASTMWMPSKGSLLEGTFGVHVRLPTYGAQAGVCFDVAGPHDFSIAQLVRRNGELLLSVFRYAGGRWMQLGSKRILLDAWRLDTWHALTVETAKTGIKIKAYDTEMKLSRAQLGDANGRIGLFACNGAANASTIEIRAFHVQAR